MILVHLPSAPPLFPPPGVHYLASYLEKKGINVSIIDINIELYHAKPDIWKNTADFLKSYKYDKEFRQYMDLFIPKAAEMLLERNDPYIGFSCFEGTFIMTQLIMIALKKASSGVKIIAGGPDVYEHIGMYKELVNKDIIDFIVLKEGEKKLLSILTHQTPLPEGIITKDNISKNYDHFKDTIMLDLETESHPLSHIKHYPEMYAQYKMLPVYASRGCSSNCTFCAHKILWDGYRVKKPISMIRELNLYKRKFQTSTFYFVDMLLNGNRQFLTEFIQLLMINPHKFLWSSYFRVDPLFQDQKFVSNLVKAGLRFISIGVESHSQFVLNRVKKGTRIADNIHTIRHLSQAGLFLHISFIIGLPGESLEYCIDTLEFVKDMIWYMDHIEIFFFQNYKQSIGYAMSEEDLNEPDNAYDHSFKKDLFGKYLVKFNDMGSFFIHAKYIYHEHGPIYKKTITDYYKSNKDDCDNNHFSLELKKSHPLISEDSLFMDIMKNMYKFKMEQIQILQNMINEIRQEL